MWPLKWSTDKKKSFSTFKECYEGVLSPIKKDKYGGGNYNKYKKYVDSFFAGGGYKFLTDLESKYDDCASICFKPLFFISKDISKGMPKRECLQASIDTAALKAQTASSLLFVTAIFIFISIAMVFPLCFRYQKTK